MPRLRAPFILSGITAALLLASCGGGGGSNANNTDPSAQQKSQLQVAITDAPGDFLGYTVDIKSISLKKANGTVVETIPVTSRIDFTQYTDLTELFNVLTVPTGTYSEVDLNLDYSNAEILIEGADGKEVTPKVVDTDGNAIKDISLALKFPDNQQFEVKPGLPAQLSIDFDLSSSNEVDVNNKTVTVEPILYASTQLNHNRDHRVRGLLKSTDATADTFVVDLLPLYLRRGSFGEASVKADANTDWVINGTKYTGLDGVPVLAALAKDTPIVVVGKVSQDSDVVTATSVLAGSSVPWVGREAVQGVVIARSGNKLTVRGRAIQVEDTATVSHYENIPVTMDTTTAVTRQVLSDTGLNTDAVSVGQRVTVFGALTQSSAGDYSMDATKGQVHMEINQVEGDVVTSSPLVLNLEEINGRSPKIFDFKGTGRTTADDTDPAKFSVETGALALSGITADEYIKVRGYENAFGSAPKDFNAQTLIDSNQEHDDMLFAYWNPSQNTDAVLAFDKSGIELNTDETAHGVLFVQIVDKNGIVKTDPATLTLIPDQDGLGNFAVKGFRDHDMTVSHSFEGFEALVKSNDDAGKKLVGIQAVGKYNATTGEFEASNANAIFKGNDGRPFDWDEDKNPGKNKEHGHHH